MTKTSSSSNKTYRLTITGLMIALTAIMAFTPLGTIPIGAISVTIAHIPILITVLLVGFPEGFFVALAFGLFSMLRAILAPQGLLDPLFMNPLISILPRLLIPVTTYWVYRGVRKINNTAGVVSAIVLGNLTNTFFVYLSMYLFLREKVEALTGKNFLTVVVGLVSTSTAIKTVIVAVITTPIVLGLQKYLKSRGK